MNSRISEENHGKMKKQFFFLLIDLKRKVNEDTVSEMTTDLR